MCDKKQKKSSAIEMTTGSLWKNMLMFSIPLMFSQVLEVLFNLSDVAVVEKEPKVEGRSMTMFLAEKR